MHITDPDIPEGTIIRDAQGRTWEAQGDDYWLPVGSDQGAQGWEGIIRHPITVLHPRIALLHTPEEEK